MSSDQRTTVVAVAAGVLAGTALSYYGYTQYKERAPKWKRQRELLKEYEAAMLPGRDKVQQLEDDILKQMKDGLAKKGGSSIMMLPTYVLRLPDGTETGDVFAIDMGGTNFRCYYCKLSDKPGAVDAEDMEQQSIPPEVYTGSGEQLFDFLAKALAAFIKKRAAGGGGAAQGARPVVGFGFSFPMDQRALNSGVLMQWTKGYDVSGVIGKDVVPLLSAALERAGCPCRVTVVLNDTVAVLAGARYHDPATSIGCIMGTGTNAAISVPVRGVKWWNPAGAASLPASATTAINTEWGCYGSQHLPRVAEDLALDAESGPRKGQMLIEKLMSGLWLGEAARRVLLTFAERTQLLGEVPPKALAEPGSFSTAMLSEIESDGTPLRWRAARTLRALGVPSSCLGLETLLMVQAVCRLLVRRSARTFVALLAAVLRLQGFDASPTRTVVAVDGGVALKYANWRHYTDQYLRESLGKDLAKKVVFRAAADASSFGGAVLAAAAAQEGKAGAQAGASPSKAAAGSSPAKAQQRVAGEPAMVS